MKFKAKKRVILSDFEPFLTLKFAKKMFSRAMLPYRAVANADGIFFSIKPAHFFHNNNYTAFKQQTFVLRNIFY